MTVLDERGFWATLMSKDVPIANIHGRRIEPIQEHLLPLQLQRMGDIETWLSMRAIDEHRVNSRLPVSYTHLDVYKRQVYAIFILDHKTHGRACY